HRKMIEQLILAGAFDETYSNRASLLASLDSAMEQGELFKEFVGQSSLFQNELQLETSYEEIEDFSQVKKLATEKELLGMYITIHPLQHYLKMLRKKGYVTANDAKQLSYHMNVAIIAIIQDVKTLLKTLVDRLAF